MSIREVSATSKEELRYYDKGLLIKDILLIYKKFTVLFKEEQGIEALSKH